MIFMDNQTRQTKTISFGKAAVILLLAMLLPTILLQGILMLMVVPSESMAPTLNSGDVLIGSRIFSELERGDIVVFERENTLLIKRIVGLPGEEVRIAQDGTIFIDGKTLQEEYVSIQREGRAQTFQVPEDCYLLLGDNRGHSYDARYWENPYVPRSAIRAVAVKKLFSVPAINLEGEFSWI